MAGSEKTCEITGEHHGWKMYHWKRNHIQIVPWVRKTLRGKQAELHIVATKTQLVSRMGMTQWVELEDFSYDPPWTLKGRLVTQYDFELTVDGQVFRSSTWELRSTVKRLRRMLRDYSLEAKWLCSKVASRKELEAIKLAQKAL